MFTTVAYSENIATTDAWQKVTAVPDQHIKITGDSVYISGYNRYIGALAVLGTHALGGRLVSPSIRRFAPSEISPISIVLITTDPVEMDINLNRMITLDIDEQLELEFYGTAVAAQQLGAAVWLADAEITPVKGQIFTVRGSIVLAGAAGAWEYSALSLAEDLPVGSYDIVGFDVVAANGVAARLVPVGANHRPGVPVRQTIDAVIPNNIFRHGKMGVFASFPHNNIPGVEVFSNTAIAGATYQVLLDLIKR
jgi:hypothetical protein